MTEVHWNDLVKRESTNGLMMTTSQMVRISLYSKVTTREGIGKIRPASSTCRFISTFADQQRRRQRWWLLKNMSILSIFVCCFGMNCQWDMYYTAVAGIIHVTHSCAKIAHLREKIMSYRFSFNLTSLADIHANCLNWNFILSFCRRPRWGQSQKTWPKC